MPRKFKRATIFAFALPGLIATSAWAFSCQVDCEVDYKAAVQACRVNYGQQSDESNPQDMQNCLDNAMRVYQACLQDCKS